MHPKLISNSQYVWYSLFFIFLWSYYIFVWWNDVRRLRRGKNIGFLRYNLLIFSDFVLNFNNFNLDFLIPHCFVKYLIPDFLRGKIPDPWFFRGSNTWSLMPVHPPIKTEKRCFYCEFEIYFYCSLDIWSSMLLLLCMQTNCRQQQINLCFFKDIIQSSPWQQFLFSYMHPKWHYLHDPIKMNTNALSTTMLINIICLDFKIKYKQYLTMCTISKHNITQWVKVNDPFSPHGL